MDAVLDGFSAGRPHPETEGRIGQQFAIAMSEFLAAEIERIMTDNLTAADTTDFRPVGDPSIRGHLA